MMSKQSCQALMTQPKILDCITWLESWLCEPELEQNSIWFMQSASHSEFHPEVD